MFSVTAVRTLALDYPQVTSHATLSSSIVLDVSQWGPTHLVASTISAVVMLMLMLSKAVIAKLCQASFLNHSSSQWDTTLKKGTMTKRQKVRKETKKKENAVNSCTLPVRTAHLQIHCAWHPLARAACRAAHSTCPHNSTTIAPSGAIVWSTAKRR